MTLLYKKPVINVNEAALHLNITYKAARDLIKDFEKHHILKEEKETIEKHRCSFCNKVHL